MLRKIKIEDKYPEFCISNQCFEMGISEIYGKCNFFKPACMEGHLDIFFLLILQKQQGESHGNIWGKIC